MVAEKLPSIEEALEEIRRKPLVDLWPTVGARLLPRHRLRRGGTRQHDVSEVGRLKKAVSAPLRRKLGI